jgi:hypothetical protein
MIHLNKRLWTLSMLRLRAACYVKMVTGFSIQPQLVAGSFENSYDESLATIKARFWYVQLRKPFRARPEPCDTIRAASTPR